jgi:membrane protein
VRRVATGAYEDNVFFLASALTFDALVAAIPFVALLLAILGYVVQARMGGAGEVHVLLERLLPAHGDGPADPLAQAERMVTRVVASRGRLTVYAGPLFLWFGLRFFGSVRAALNEVFDTEEQRNWLVGKGVDLVLVLVTLTWLVAMSALTAPNLRVTWASRFVVSSTAFLLGTGLFYVIYTLAPSRRIRTDTALVAAVVAALAFELAQKFYAIYVTHFATLDKLVSDANAIALALFILWIYYTACVFLVGGEVAMTYDLLRRQKQQQTVLT